MIWIILQVWYQHTHEHNMSWIFCHSPWSFRNTTPVQSTLCVVINKRTFSCVLHILTLLYSWEKKKRNLLCCLLLLMLSNRGRSSWFWNLLWTVRERSGLFHFWLKQTNIFNESYLSPVRFHLFWVNRVYGGSFARCTKRTVGFSLHMLAVTSDLTETWCMKNCCFLFFCRWRPERRLRRSQTKSNLLLVRSDSISRT